MELLHFILLFGAALLAGAINSVAGGGTFFAFPALIFAGVPPIAANATATIAVWPGALASAIAYRRELQQYGRRLPLLVTISVLGGGIGALVLLNTPSQTFEFLIPWLLLIATALFAFGRTISTSLRQRFALLAKEDGKLALAASILLQLGIAVYGGYFGAGIGILMLAMLALLGMTHIHEMNALKTLLGTCINGIAVIIFIVCDAVYWSQASVMIAGAIAGGYLGAHYARRLPPEWVRKFVVATAVLMTAYFFWD